MVFMMELARFLVAPVRERGLKSHGTGERRIAVIVAPVRERGLKFLARCSCQRWDCVAPVRERGLKFKSLPCDVGGYRSLP